MFVSVIKLGWLDVINFTLKKKILLFRVFEYVWRLKSNYTTLINNDRLLHFAKLRVALTYVFISNMRYERGSLWFW
jgi:hypothetical protein